MRIFHNWLDDVWQLDPARDEPVASIEAADTSGVFEVGLTFAVPVRFAEPVDLPALAWASHETALVGATGVT